MSKKKKIEERKVEVIKGTGSYETACAEVKKMSGFDFCVPLRGRVISGGKAEYEFLVGSDENALKSELFSRQLEAERSG